MEMARSGGLPSAMRDALCDVRRLAIARSAFRSADAHEILKAFVYSPAPDLAGKPGL